MQRRAWLRALGTGAVGVTAGCGALGSTSCDPADDRIGDLSIHSRDYEVDIARYSSESVTIRGTAVYETVRGFVLDDGTGLAEIVARRSDERIDKSTIEVGDCLEGTGPVNVVQSGTNELPYVGVRSLEERGHTADVEPLPDYPVPSIDPSYDRDTRESVFTLTGGDPVTAGELVVRWRPDGAETPWPETERAGWHELTDVGPDERVPEGSAFRLDGDEWSVSVLWTSEDGRWSREVQSVGVSTMNP